MNEVTVFNFEANEVRTVIIDNEAWFVGKDVAQALGYQDTPKAIKQHVDSDDRLTLTGQNAHLENLPNRGVVGVNESGVYSLIFGSKLESAKQFKKWVTSEVLPAIRKHGTYMTNEKAEALINRPNDTLADLLIQAGEQLKAKDVQISEMKPKALFADAVSASQTSILVGELAKLLKQNGVEIGANRLFTWLRESGYLIRRKGTDYNMPTQRSMELELFEIKEHNHINSNGVNVTTKTPKVTGKGQQYFINKFLQAA
ncbi:phage repressor protein/antirepressor Ant [Leuconostoc lactis]|uniref:phage antirepressor n=1 Tax=Leuconostoc lactis TaxID=1246 RepID=UPI0011BB4C1A|nr:phage antirepressor KilAC domain-containing protein [Leuconostoc lactis]QEA48103.1 phage repressor protein/antirepressor Ant [Leuconostoc lactis]